MAIVGASGLLKDLASKGGRFVWRASRNLACTIPGGSRVLFPAERLAARFGRGDADYALQVYRHHANQLTQAGFKSAAQVLEVGPGRNLGSALLWWSRAVAEGATEPCVTLWDVHANAAPEAPNYRGDLAGQLLECLNSTDGGDALVTSAHQAILDDVTTKRLHPRIEYFVCAIDRLQSVLEGRRFDMVCSHAALEHVWRIDEFWRIASRLTAPGGWHSHRIDLADHGRRETNYLEMLEWSAPAWWLTARFVSGAVNRWRANDHVQAFAAQGMQLRTARREQRAALPIPRRRLSRAYRGLEDAELMTTAVDIVGCRSGAKCGS